MVEMAIEYSCAVDENRKWNEKAGRSTTPIHSPPSRMTVSITNNDRDLMKSMASLNGDDATLNSTVSSESTWIMAH